MGTSLEELRVLKVAEELADGVWKIVDGWDAFSRESVGLQLVRATDSIGANIAESFGRYHYGEKLQFLYYARGSLFETKYWINRATARSLCTVDIGEDYANRLTDLARQLNAFASGIKKQRSQSSGSLKESPTLYNVSSKEPEFEDPFDLTQQDWLQTAPPTSTPNL